MTNEYLIDIHKYISGEIARAQSGINEAEVNNETESRRFYEGQLAEWNHLRAYLAETVNLKTQKYV